MLTDSGVIGLTKPNYHYASFLCFPTAQLGRFVTENIIVLDTTNEFFCFVHRTHFTIGSEIIEFIISTLKPMPIRITPIAASSLPTLDG